MDGRRAFRFGLLLALGAAALAQRGTPGPPSGALEWVRIPGGTFMMGTASDLDALPIHRVSVAAFEMLKTPVTFGQYRACVKAGACAPYELSAPGVPVGDLQPAVGVSWYDARDFARWIGGRLPSEAEWEYAAKGAGGSPAACIEAVDGGCDRLIGMGCERRPICSHPEWNTPQGLCDMSGDAWEWVEDWYHDSYSGAPSDGRAWDSPKGLTRVSRLGTWRLCSGDVGAATRDDDVPDFVHDHLGFRVARSIPADGDGAHNVK